MKRVDFISSKDVVKNISGMRCYSVERLVTDLLLYAEASLGGNLIYFKTKECKRYSWYRIGFASCFDFIHFAQMFLALGFKVDNCKIRLDMSYFSIVRTAHRIVVEFMNSERIINNDEYKTMLENSPIEVNN